ncbi:MAG: hypothetical protein IJ733_14330, partial [Lachnospiraceae bacterium]|nr:hypothetical protein [Lachnospiraceae bacterium]
YGSNIIWLYAGDTSGKTTKLSGSLYYENRSVGSSFSVDPVLPVAGGVLFCGSASGVSDEDGTVETGSFVLPDSAMVYDNSMKLVKQSFDSLNKQNYLYVQATATVNANSGGHVVNLNYNGTTQLGQLVIPVNTSSSSAYVFDRVEVTNDGLSTSYMHMNGIPSTIKARVRGVSSAAANEHIKKVELLVIDRTTYAEKTSYEMAEDLSSAGDYTLTVTFDKEGYDVSSYEEGDLLFLRMTTDKKQELLSDNDMPDDVRKKLEETTYEMVNTGFMLTKTGEPAEPIVQTMDFDDMPGMDNIPLCNSLDANFKLGPVKVSLETLKDENGNAVGQRIQAGLDPEKFAEKFAYDKDDNPNGMTWDGTQKGAIGKKVNKLKQIKGNYNKAKSALSGNSSLSSDALAKKAASLGAKQWGVFPAIGFYMDFGKVAEYDEETGAVKSTSYVLQGGGIYLGASAKFAVNWYAIIPVVYIPCYFGVSGELSFMNTFTGYNPKTGHQTAPDEYLMSSHNVTKDLEYNYQLDVGATVQVYAGIGLCGVLGVRGGMSVSAEVLWYPTLHVAKDYFDETGENVTVTFYMEVDILIGTIQIASWCPADENWGLLKQIEQFDGMTEEEIDALFPPEQNETLANPVKKAKDFTEEATAAYALKERTKAAKWSGQVKELSPTMMYPASDIENSGSAAMKQIQRLRASFEEESSTLLKNDYDHPDTKLLDMGDDGTLMVFLQNDDTKSDAEFTSLSYVVYKNGEFVTEPVKIQTDKTADFQPDVCDAGKDVIFTWISSPDGTEMSGKDGWKEGDGNLAKYLLKQEIYTVRVPKTTLTAGGAIDQSTIVRLTDDESYPLGGETQFFDANPKIAYDETSGSYCIYYVKTGYDKNAKLKSPTDLANPMNTSGETYSAIVFRIYDNEKGEWVTDDVKSGENMGRYADAPDAYKELIKQAGGQRFLQSVLVDGAISKADPLIADFTAFSSQGYAVFAYTIDWDNNAETDEDRDLYIQFYEHATRKSSSPIRVTKDSVSDSMPQIVRRAGKTESYVFWKRDGGLSYFNLTDLVKEGLDTSSGNIEVEKDLLTDGVLLYEAADDGSQAAEDTGSSQTSDDTEEYDTSETGGYAYAFHAFTVDALSESETENNSFSAYQTAVDEKDNLYIVWIANATDELADGQTMTSQEIFATAMVDSAVVRDDEGVEITSLKRWAPANRLTHTGSYCDEPALALTKGGEMLLVYNNYDLTADKEIGTGENEGRVRFSNVKTTNMKLKASRMKAVGSIGVADMEVSDTTPAAGEDITVSMRFTNRGLTASKNGFTADIYEVKGNEKKHLTTYTFKEGLAPADWVNYSFTWQAAEDTVGSHVLVEVKEADIDGICGTAESEVFEKKAQYHIINARYYQGADANFYADVTVENKGNADSAEGDLLTMNFAG